MKRALLILAALFAAESVSAALFAWGVRRDTFPQKTFSRLAFGRLYFPSLAETKWEKDFGLRERAGDDMEAYSFSRNFRPDALIGWRPRENARVVRFGYPSLINAEGFASIRDDGDSQYTMEKEKGVFRVIVLGGSTVGGVGAVPSASIPAQLDARLAARLGRDRVEVINAGSDSFTSSAEFLYLLTELVHWQPDLVVVYDGWNEIDVNNVRASKMGAGWFNLRVRDTDPKSRVVDTIYRPGPLVRELISVTGESLKLRLLSLYEASSTIQLARALAPAPFRGIDNWFGGRRPRELWEPPYDSRIETAYEDNLALMGTVARQFHFRIAFFLQPFMGLSKKPLTEKEESFFRQLGKRELENRVRFAAAAGKIFERLRKQAGRDTYAENLTDLFETTREQVYSYTAHLNAAGNTIVAARIESSLAKIGWLAPPKR